MRLVVLRVVAVVVALSWLVLPGFGLIDLGVSWNPDWPVVLEASWGVSMTVLVAGSFLTMAWRPSRAAPALVPLTATLAAWVLSAAAGREPELLGYAALLAVETALVGALLRAVGGERLLPLRASVSWPLLVVAAAGAVPWSLQAVDMYRLNAADVAEAQGDITMGVDHYAVQGALAVTLVALPLAAACWPRGRTHLGASAGLAAGYLGLVSLAFPGADAAFGPVWSGLCLAWGAAVAVLAVAGRRLELRELRGEVVEAERAL